VFSVVAKSNLSLSRQKYFIGLQKFLSKTVLRCPRKIPIRYEINKSIRTIMLVEMLHVVTIVTFESLVVVTVDKNND
jgi:hypothetical protein